MYKSGLASLCSAKASGWVHYPSPQGERSEANDYGLVLISNGLVRERPIPQELAQVITISVYLATPVLEIATECKPPKVSSYIPKNLETLKTTINTFALLSCLILAGCASFNEFGLRRNKFNLEKIKPNKDVNAYKIVDTTKIYKLVNIKIESDERASNDINGMNKRNPGYLKFYGNGRVGEFRNIDLTDIEALNPKGARSYLYALKKNKFIVQKYFHNPQCGECFVKKIVVKKSENQITLSSDHSVETYLAIDIPKEFLKYKPDW